ncbi:helix-turn-helix domain-containing protein [Luteolibacter yonseiensis]|uniref:Helix-turn-helix domain-containing protein n=1 Tax=Luteolibacter yonseiensis TaxID=1144680 RepID=A0A934VAL9_9BACT|nr:helix-turn-helix domain-containing protein [Luteolibacter yonseiensis]
MVTTNAPLLNRKDVGARLHVSLRTVDELIASGDLPVVRLGRAVRIRPSAIDYLIEARETRVNPRKKGASK